jgi:tRNA (guanine9-N1)-methyltransferase
LIGGIVDHNRHKKLTFNKAVAQGIRHARLPIRESGVNLTTSCVLTVNHVIDIIAQYYQLGGGKEQEIWRTALEMAIPERKRGVEPA